MSGYSTSTVLYPRVIVIFIYHVRKPRTLPWELQIFIISKYGACKEVVYYCSGITGNGWLEKYKDKQLFYSMDHREPFLRFIV